jgi:microcin C transport system ATP-binding protein
MPIITCVEDLRLLAKKRVPKMFCALDVTIQKQVISLPQNLQKQRSLSYVLITHDVGVIRAMAHDVMVMKDGDIVESGQVNDVLDTPKHPYTQRLVAAVA